MGRFWQRHKEKFWAPFEALMLLVALLAPVFFSDHSSLRSLVFQNLSISSAFLDLNFQQAQRSIASTIVSIEPLGLQQVNSTIVMDRQIRFEAVLHQEWEILSLERLLSDARDTETIPLIFDKSRQSRVTTFIELDPGLNKFQVKYRDRDGKSKQMSFVVDHLRKDSQD